MKLTLLLLLLVFLCTFIVPAQSKRDQHPKHDRKDPKEKSGDKHGNKHVKRRGRVEDLLADYDDDSSDDDDDDEDRGEWLFLLQGIRGSCKPNPCLNNGVCEEKQGRFKCKCPKPFKGRKCEKGKGACKKDTCGYGQCVLTSSPPFFECKCKAPFKPPTCKKIAPCELNPCLNGGTCEKDGQDFDCICKTGYSGKFCQVGPNDCYVGNGESYRGTVSETEEGDECLYWNSYFLLSKGTNPFRTINDLQGLGPHNYCRNPDGDSKPWCFARSGKKIKWDHCNVRKCPTDAKAPWQTTENPTVVHPPIRPTPSGQIPGSPTHESDTGGHLIPGGDTTGLPKPGDDTAGLPKPGGDTAGLPKPGGDTAGLPKPGGDTAGLPKPGGDTAGIPKPGGDTAGLPKPGGDTAGLPKPGGDPAGLPKPGGDTAGLPKPGGDTAGLPKPGGDPAGIPKPGGDTAGLPKPGGDTAGLPKPGGDPAGLPKPGGDPAGIPKPGGDTAGLPKPGGDTAGLPKPGGDTAGLPKPGGDTDGLPKPGGDTAGLPKPDSHTNGTTTSGSDVAGSHSPEILKPGVAAIPTILPVEEEFATCGKPDPIRPMNRIYGGIKALPGGHPWQASIQVRPKGTILPFRHVCGGTLIKSCWVLTAGHCIDDKKDYQVILGSINLGKSDASQQKLEVVETIIHEQYSESSDSVYNDIALLRLKDKNGKCAEESQFVKTACLPGVDFPDGTECSISGWGATPEAQHGTNQLLDADVLLISQETCSSVQVYGKVIENTMFCAGYLEGGVDSCQGDSGGPLTCVENLKHYVYGIVSWGDSCGLKNKPGVYTRVTHYVDWINRTTAKAR